MVKDRIKSFQYAFKGLKDLFVSQMNARIHAFVGILIIIAGFFFQISTTEWLVCTLTMGVVLSAEAFNTALEYLTDLVSPDYHPLAGKVKDVAAGAVLIMAIAAAIIGIIIFAPKVIFFVEGLIG